MKRRSFLKGLLAVPVVVAAGKSLANKPKPIGFDGVKIKNEVAGITPYSGAEPIGHEAEGAYLQWEEYSQSVKISGLTQEDADNYNRFAREQNRRFSENIREELFREVRQ